MKKFAGDIIVLHRCTKKSQSCDVCYLRYGVWQTKFFVIIDRVFAFLPPSGPRKLKFSKMERTLQDVIILQVFTINDSHMKYGFSDMECNRQILSSFWTVFCPFTALANQKMKILKNWKKNPWRYHHFIQVSQKPGLYTIVFLRYGT